MGPYAWSLHRSPSSEHGSPGLGELDLQTLLLKLQVLSDPRIPNTSTYIYTHYSITCIYIYTYLYLSMYIICIYTYMPLCVYKDILSIPQNT